MTIYCRGKDIFVRSIDIQNADAIASAGVVTERLRVRKSDRDLSRCIYAKLLRLSDQRTFL